MTRMINLVEEQHVDRIQDVLVELADDADVSAPGRGVLVALTEAASRACGHLAGEGAGGSPEHVAARHRIRDLCQEIANYTGRQVEVTATADDGDGWTVDILEPTWEVQR